MSEKADYDVDDDEDVPHREVEGAVAVVGAVDVDSVPEAGSNAPAFTEGSPPRLPAEGVPSSATAGAPSSAADEAPPAATAEAPSSAAALVFDLEAECRSLREKSEHLQRQLDESLSEVAVASCVRESLVELERQKECLGSEMATMQHLLQEADGEARAQQRRHDHEVARLNSLLAQLEAENRQLKDRSVPTPMTVLPGNSAGSETLPLSSTNQILLGNVDKETLLVGAAAISDATRNLAKKMRNSVLLNQSGGGGSSNVRSPPPPQAMSSSSLSSPSVEHLPGATFNRDEDDLEAGMKRAFEDTELLKAIVVPLEEQIGALKEKLRDMDTLLTESERRQAKMVLGVESLSSWLAGKPLEAVLKELEDRERDLLSYAELKGRSDQLDEDGLSADQGSGKRSVKSSDLTSSPQTLLLVSLLTARVSILRSELTSGRNELQNTVSFLEKVRAQNQDLQRQLLAANSRNLSLLRHHRTTPSTEDQENPFAVDQIEAESGPDDAVSVSKSEWESVLRQLQGRKALETDEARGRERLQELLAEERLKVEGHARNEEKLKEELVKEAEFRRKVEAEWNDKADRWRQETEALGVRLRQSQKLLEQLQLGHSTTYKTTQRDLQLLSADREKIVRELKRLQDENDNLVGKYAQRSEEMQNEVIQLPTDGEDAQFLLLRYREDLIRAKLAAEVAEEKLQSQVGFLKTQISSEQQERESLKDLLSGEIEGLNAKIVLLEGCRTELEAERQRSAEYEAGQRRQQQANVNLQAQVGALASNKVELEARLAELNARLKNLQQELDNSVAVQTDFVKLSQSLQIELEKIRQGETEVRWQHEEDVSECQSCKHTFNNISKRKQHCRHCGRIFCGDCLSKTVPSGHHQRPARVCDVCHTLLVQNSAPYFSTEPPQL